MSSRRLSFHVNAGRSALIGPRRRGKNRKERFERDLAGIVAEEHYVQDVEGHRDRLLKMLTQPTDATASHPSTMAAPGDIACPARAQRRRSASVLTCSGAVGIVPRLPWARAG